LRTLLNSVIQKGQDDCPFERNGAGADGGHDRDCHHCERRGRWSRRCRSSLRASPDEKRLTGPARARMRTGEGPGRKRRNRQAARDTTPNSRRKWIGKPALPGNEAMARERKP
jgi:hypothetical protein